VQLHGEVVDRDGVVAWYVGDPDAAAEVELGDVAAELGRHQAEQLRHPVRRQLEALGVEDLRPDVAVQPDQVEGVLVLDGEHGLGRRAGDDGEPELLVLLAGRDELVGVRLDAGRDAHHDPLPHAGLGSDPAQPLDLDEAVDHDAADPDLDRAAELVDRLVVAVELQPLRRELRPQCDGQLAAGAYVQTQSLFGDPSGDRRTQECLARVVDVGVGERRVPGPGAAAQVVLVEEVRRGAVLASRGRRRTGPPSVRTPSSPVVAPVGQTVGSII
jgi:hypothetical protein